MPLTRKFVTVYLDDDTAPDGYTEQVVEIRTADMLTAETQGKALPGVELTDGLHTLYLSTWAALCREEKFKGPFRAFVTACINVEQDTGGPEEEQTVDPTQPGASDDSP